VVIAGPEEKGKKACFRARRTNRTSRTGGGKKERAAHALAAPGEEKEREEGPLPFAIFSARGKDAKKGLVYHLTSLGKSLCLNGVKKKKKGGTKEIRSGQPGV